MFKKFPIIILVPFSFLLIALFFYWPGLTGTFLLDDFHTFMPLESLGGVDSIEKALYFILSGRAGPTGRPFALLTFLANGSNWPAESFWYLLTNVFIHAINCAMLFSTIRLFLLFTDFKKNHASTAALAISLIWLVHPLNVSTVLYIVQRMTLLSAFFSLAIIYLYVKFRFAAEQGDNRKAIFLAFYMIPLALMGFFSKENIIILPLQMLLIDRFFAYKKPSNSSALLNVQLWVLVTSSLIVLAYPISELADYLYASIIHGQPSVSHREFDTVERFLTQQRVVIDYLLGVFTPSIQGSGVFYDSYPISTGIMTPSSTVVCFIVNVGLISSALILRIKKPEYFLCILWFYLSLYLESTFHMLELKYEHRSYLASVGLISLTVYLGAHLLGGRIKMICYIIVLVVFSVALSFRARLWGDPVAAAEVWVQNSPKSPRALENAAFQHIKYKGNYASAQKYLKAASDVAGTAAAQLKYVAAFCDEAAASELNFDDIAEKIQKEPPNNSLYVTLGQILQLQVNDDCDLVSSSEYVKLLNAFRSNPFYERKLSIFYIDEYELRLLLHSGKYEQAKALQEKFFIRVQPLAITVRRGGIFATLGYFEIAERELRVRLAVAKEMGLEASFEYQQALEVYSAIQEDIRNTNE